MRKLLPTLALGLVVATSGCGATHADTKAKREQADYHYQLAFGYLFDPNAQARDPNLSFQEALKATETDPTHAEAQFLMGLLLMGRQQYLEAADRFKKAIATKPDFYFAQNNLGATYIAMERWDDAIAVLTPLVQDLHYTTPANAQNNLGWAHYKRGDRAAARNYFVHAIQTTPDLCPAYNNYAVLLIDEDNLEKAKEKLEEAIRRCPGYAEPYFHLGRIQARSPEGTEVAIAARNFRKCVDLSGDTPLADRCKRQLKSLAVEEAP